MTARIGLAGTGSHMPDTVINNDDLARLIKRDGKDNAWVQEKLGIRERRFMTSLDNDGHPTRFADELDMAEKAARDAIANAGLHPQEVDGLWYVSCTQHGHDRHHFSRSSFELHRRLGLKKTTVPIEMDAGCGGAVHALSLGSKMLAGNGMDNMLVVAANAPSRYYGSWEQYVASNEWLPMYIFGDGAGAVMLRKTSKILSGSQILASYLAVDPAQQLMYYQPRGNSRDPLYIIDGRAVAIGFATYAYEALENLRELHPFEFDDVARFYFHQVNGRVLEKFVDKVGLPPEKVAMHVDKYGNIAAAATLVLLDEDRRQGLVTEGDLCVFCTVGAGAQYGAMLVRL